MSVRYGFLLLCLVAGIVPSSADDCAERLKPQTEVGERLELGLSLKPGDAPLSLFANGARYIRAQIAISDQSACDWSLVVRDEKFRPVQVLKKGDFAGGTRWTSRVYSTHLLIDLQNCSDKSLSVVVQQYIAVPNSAKNPYYSLKNSPNAEYQDLYDSPQLNPSAPAVSNSVKRLGDNVALLMLSYDRQSWICSGVMLAEGFVLTNYHCGGVEPVPAYWREDIVTDLLVDISWDGDNVSREYTGIRADASKCLEF